ncbi:MAG: hypothetical protein M3Z04_00080 [Chloroflexota bacterium]|nr:hypothetical protein [Chloroflexota bacterium]
MVGEPIQRIAWGEKTGLLNAVQNRLGCVATLPASGIWRAWSPAADRVARQQ